MELGAPFGLRPSQRTALKTSAISPESKRATSSAGMGFWHSDSGLNQKFDPGSIGNMSLAMAPKQVSGSLTIAARREQVLRQYDAAPENIERDKFQERIAKLSGGTAIIMAGGATPVEQKRRTQLIEDSINATRAAIEEGIVPGGGVALLKSAPALDPLIAELSAAGTRAPNCCSAPLAGHSTTSRPIAGSMASARSPRWRREATATGSTPAPAAWST